MTDSRRSILNERFIRVLDHIDTHLDGDLSLETLAGVAALSPCHFHRQFRAHLGIALHLYVQLTRIKRASYQLALRDRQSITQIAYDAGFAAPESFARAFHRMVQQWPRDFRGKADWLSWLQTLTPLTEARSLLMPDFTFDCVETVFFEPTAVAIMEHRGDPRLLHDTISDFIAWRRAHKLPPSRSRTFNIFHNDPGDTPSDNYRMDLCAGLPEGFHLDVDAPVKAGIIPGGRCALLRQTGNTDDLRKAADFLYREWLSQSGESLRDYPLFCERLQLFPEVPENSAVVELYLPLA
ncbi:AraC family transcriptional regulator [Altericroceibacterium endophyticum]|uniref:Helix-turn-helix domain-containing protein n=1 Tax=Altericroceibacterium endophyticum TaxID=1808508 RepID=A0A6I4T5J8_9SPHN|nr:AraC family transcriptional regulator [Altericroceibacterium endophyticum]MXO65421.1 helix-turn-helix domain-containing protein [Altericroceibacterium endophyticum]